MNTEIEIVEKDGQRLLVEKKYAVVDDITIRREIDALNQTLFFIEENVRKMQQQYKDTKEKIKLLEEELKNTDKDDDFSFDLE